MPEKFMEDEVFEGRIDREAVYETLAAEETKLFFNGINGATGEYGIPPMTGGEFAERIVEGPREQPGELRLKKVKYPIDPTKDPRKLDQAGWAVVFPAEMDAVQRAAIKEALAPLLQQREADAGELFKVYEGGDGYRPGEDKDAYFNRIHVSPGVAKPKEMPYYVMLVGGPEQIPYEFQYQLDVMRAVGRIDFGQDLAAYERYAKSVAAAERGEYTLPLDARFFGVRNEGDEATRLSSKFLIQRVHEALKDKDYHLRRANGEALAWNLGDVPLLDERTHKAQLARLLGGEETPALLFTASHGMEFPMDDARQHRHQGALLCRDWPGPDRWTGGTIPERFYFSADDLAGNAKLAGLIALFFACYGAGTPKEDQFAAQAFASQRAQIAPGSFVAALPQKMLGLGALAVIGHVERAWGYSFISPNSKVQTGDFEILLTQLLQGDRVGLATEALDLRYADLGTQISQNLEDFKYGSSNALTPYALAERWTRNNDARGYVVLGDPAAQLPIAPAAVEPTGRPDLGVVFAPSGEPSPAVTAGTPGTAMSPAGEGPAAGAAGEAFIFGRDKRDDPEAQAKRASMWESLNNIVGDMARQVKAALDNVTSLEVNTYTSADLENVDYDPQERKFTGTLKIRARTHISFDGDTEICLPVLEDGTVDRELWQFHEEMVKQAQANRAEFVRIVADLAARIVRP